MASKPCVIAQCRQCRPGRPCAESIRWEREEDRGEEVDASHDAFLADHWFDTPAFWDSTGDPRDALFNTRTWADALDALDKLR